MKILLIGCGKMGSAIMNGWLTANIVTNEQISVVDPTIDNKDYYKSVDEIEHDAGFTHIVLGVKPQVIDEILPKLKKFENAIFISIIAGKTIQHFKHFLPNAKIIRTMPNLPATIGAGVTVYYNSGLDESAKNSVLQLLNTLGTSLEIHDEKLFDIVTAISGSGPAYVYLIAETMMRVAIENGLDQPAAQQLVTETIIGSMRLSQSSDLGFNQLKNNVTSKGGTTEAALKILQNGDFERILTDAITAAKTRSKQLSN